MDFARLIKNFFFLLIAVFSGAALTLIAVGVNEGTELVPVNLAVEEAVSHIRTPLLTSFFLFVTNLGSPFVLTSLSIILAIMLLLNRDTYDALLYLVSIFLAVAAFAAIKNALHIP